MPGLWSPGRRETGRSRRTRPLVLAGQDQGVFFGLGWLATLLVALPLLAACGAASPGSGPAAGVSPAAEGPGAVATYPLTIADGLGRQVRLERAPQRIVSYKASNTETLFALGAGDRVVGTDDYSDYPPAAKALPKLGGVQANVNLEALVALQPDLVVTTGARPDFATLLEPQRIPVIVLDYKDITGTLANVELLGKVVDKPVEAARLVDTMRQRLAAVEERTRSARKVRVYYELDGTSPSNPYTAGPGSFIDDLITRAGGTNVAAGAKGEFPRISAEEVVNANPEVIVVPTGSFSPPNVTDPATFAQRPGWSEIEAVRQGAIRGIDADIIFRPGPRLVDALDALARAIHPELFG
jgi:iron complex transport system substrate-binding protein